MTRDEAIKELELIAKVTMWNDRREAIEMAIEALQLDVVHCEECEWWQKQDDSLQGRCAKYEFYPTGRYFCAGGERREE